MCELGKYNKKIPNSEGHQEMEVMHKENKILGEVEAGWEKGAEWLLPRNWLRSFGTAA